MKRPHHLLNVEEAASILDVSRMTVYRYIEYGWLKRYRIKGTRTKVFKRTEVEAFRDSTPTIVLEDDDV